MFTIDAKHSVGIFRAFIPHPRLWPKYKIDEPKWLYVRSLAIPYRDSQEWLVATRTLRAIALDNNRPSQTLLVRLIRYKEANIAFAIQNGNVCIGIADYQGAGREFRMSRRKFYFPLGSAQTGFDIIEGLIRQQNIDGGLLYMRDGDEIVEVDDWYEEEAEE